MSRGFLKRERDIFIKPALSGEKMAFMCTPALRLAFTGDGVGIEVGLVRALPT